ncbi:hypothetical protein ACNAW0_29410 [Micromonospora sp. SL1-18]|uniref:hypothetical protein n=1 Tax=Micromonospora sp. SL1-18 TaxID=3399128 RepID=UPI003A4E4D68
MADILKRFWAWAISLAGIVGLYMGAEQLRWVPVFWWVLAAAAVLGVIPAAGKRAFNIYSKVQAHPSLMEKVATLESETEALREKLAAAKKAAKESLQAGILEGRAQVIGAVLSEQVEPPRLVGVAETDGTLLLIGECRSDIPQKEARFTVIGQVVGEKKGAVEVIYVDQLKQSVHMQCIEETIPRFWSHLRERVSYDPSPPARVELVAYTATDPQVQYVEPVPVVSDASEVAS